MKLRLYVSVITIIFVYVLAVVYLEQNYVRNGISLLMSGTTSQNITSHSATPKPLIDCADVKLNLTGRNYRRLWNFKPTWESVRSHIRSTTERTVKCKNKEKIAIIVPYRNREKQLLEFLHRMVPLFRRQNLNYTLFVVEQTEGETFNKAKLMNAAFLEVSKAGKFDCYFFHDVDILLENDNCLYTCSGGGVKHLSTQLNKYSYKHFWYGWEICREGGNVSWVDLPTFGGITRITKELFETVNGYSNLYWGWGAEDDDYYLRFVKKGIKPTFNNDTRCKFAMVKHGPEKKSIIRGFLLRHSNFRTDIDGLNSVKYKVISHEQTEMYTHLMLDIGSQHSLLTEFNSSISCDEGESWLRQFYHIKLFKMTSI